MQNLCRPSGTLVIPLLNPGLPPRGSHRIAPPALEATCNLVWESPVTYITAGRFSAAENQPNGAAARLGMHRSTVQFRMKKLGISVVQAPKPS